MKPWHRTVKGIQLHHVTDLQDAGRHLGNAAQATLAAGTRTGDLRYAELRSRIVAIATEAKALEEEARARLEAMDREQFTRCREGEEPWPDEVGAGFIPRHTCEDQCLYHDHNVLDALTQCICARPPCRACELEM